MREENSQNRPTESKPGSPEAAGDRLERRRMIRAAVASVPVVLTFSAGTAYAQDASVVDSKMVSTTPDPGPGEANVDSGEHAMDEFGGSLTPAEELETFGLEGVDRPAGYDEDPYRNLDDNFDSP